jgi:predicted ABC-class ATPase
MRDKKEFFNILEAIDGRRFQEFNKIVGDFDFARYVLKFHFIPEEPSTTLFVVRVPQIIAGFPPHTYNSPVRRTGLEDLLTRSLADRIHALRTGVATGRPRRYLSVAAPGQKILPRSSMVVTDEFVEARIYVDLPHNRGRVDSEEAARIFFDDVPYVVSQGLIYCNLDEAAVDRFVDVMEDADNIRQILATQGLVSFVAEGSLMERQPNTDLPNRLSGGKVGIVDELLQDIEVPNAGRLRGVGIPVGLTVLVGDAGSGRAELVKAIASGIYNHVPDDGREYVVTAPDAVYVSADPGRSIQRVDISAFLASVPGQKTTRYSSICATPAISQMAGTIEALEVGARALVFDESDSASEFLSGNALLTNALEGKESLVTSLASRARELVDDVGVSLVIGAWSLANDFLGIADTILYIDSGVVRDITRSVKAGSWPMLPKVKSVLADQVERSRWVVASSIDPSLGQNDAHIEAPDLHHLLFGRSTLDLTQVTQLADRYQTSTIGLILQYARNHYMDEGRPLREMLDLVDRDLSTEGLETLVRELRGDLVRPRRYEIAAALNRLETLRISQIEG